VGEPLGHLDELDVEDPADLQQPVPPRILGIEAAHVRWFELGAPDDLDNGLALCSLHHELFDRGMPGLDDHLAVVVSQRFSARTSQGRAVHDLHGQRLRPRPGTPVPAERHVAWHREQVFQGTALAG
jgi:putative restriction endonuclease